MTTLLGMYNQVQAISSEFNTCMEGRGELYRKANREISLSAEKAVFSNLKYVVRLPQYADYDLTGLDETIKETVIEGRALVSYNIANQFVRLKRHLRLFNRYKRMHDQYMNNFKKWYETLDKIIEDSKRLAFSKTKDKLLSQVRRLQADIYSEMFTGSEIIPYNPIKDGTWIDLFMHSEFKIKKHDALQLLTLEHDNLYTLQLIAKVPNELDREGFEKLIFLVNAEKASERLFFDLYMKRMIDALNSSEKLREKTWDVFNEIIGPVPTYRVVTDEFGNVISAEQNKPKLKVISTAEKRD